MTVAAPAAAGGAAAGVGVRGDGRPALDAAARLPETETTLSLLQPVYHRCEWRQVEAANGESRSLASLPGDCRGGRVAISPDGRSGAVWFDPGRLFLVPLATGRTTPAAPVPMPPRAPVPAPIPLPPGLRDLGFDSLGRLVALTVQQPTTAELASGRVRLDGVSVPLSPTEGGAGGEAGERPVLVHALVWTAGGGWHRTETASSTDDRPDSPTSLGVLALRASGHLGFRSAEVLMARVQGDMEVDRRLLAGLAAFAPRAHPVPGEAEWIRFGSERTRFEIWEIDGDAANPTGLAALLDGGGRPRQPPGWPFTEHDFVSYNRRDACVLAAADRSGRRARLYCGERLLWSSDSAAAVTFWPRPPRR